MTTLTNTHIPETVALTVKKAWDDDNNRDGIRPTELTVALLAVVLGLLLRKEEEKRGQA